MDMASYLKDIEYAVTGTLGIIWSEHFVLREMSDKLAILEKQTDFGYRRSETWLNDPLFDDDEGIGTMMHWDTYFGPDKERHDKAAEIAELEATMQTHNFSVSALSGPILQLAKQGISLVHGGPENCPDGRLVGSRTLKEIVFQARNQSMHWDEGRLHPPVVACFDALALEIDAKYGAYQTQSLAFEIVEMLGWTDFQAFQKDMQLLA